MVAFIFDFNGTLFRDSHLHEQAWQQFIQKLINRQFSAAEFDQIHGRENHLVLENILGRSLTKAEADVLSEEKEAIYRQLVLQGPPPQLINGVTEYLDFLQEQRKSMNIATASPKSNLDFYFDLFQLERWFTYDQVIYNDGSLRSKPAPDYFLQAAAKLKVDPAETIIFEDSPLGIQGAAAAHPQRIVAVSTTNNQQKLAVIEAVDLIIDDFTDPRIRELAEIASGCKR